MALFRLDKKENVSKGNLFVALLAGLLGLAMSKLGFFCIIDGITLNMPLSLLPAMLAAATLGPMYGWIAALLGGAWYPFILWSNNGWANVLTLSITLLNFHLICRQILDLRQHKMQKVGSTFLMVFTLFWLAYALFFNFFATRPLPFWSQNAIPAVTQKLLFLFALKDTLALFFLTTLTVTLLHFPYFRKMFGLPVPDEMKPNNPIFFIIISISLAEWLLIEIFKYRQHDLLEHADEFFSLVLFSLYFGITLITHFVVVISEGALLQQQLLRAHAQESSRLNEESRIRFSAAFYDSPYAMSITNRKTGIILELNEAFVEWTGYTREDLIGKSAMEIGFWKDDNSRRKMLETLDKNSDNRTEISFINKNGIEKICWLSFRTFATQTEQYIISHLIDITSVRRMEKELYREEERYRLMVEYSPEAVVILNMADMRFVSVSDSAVELYKTSKENLLKMGPLDFSPRFQPDGTASDQKAKAYLQQALGGKRVNFYWLHNNWFGEQIHCEIDVIRMPDDTNPLLRCSIRDITERKQFEETMRLNNERFNYVVKATHDAIWDLNVSTNKVYRTGEGFEVLFGYPQAVYQHPDFHWSDIIHPDDLPLVLESMQQAFDTAGKTFWSMEYRLRKANDEYAYVSDKAYIIRNNMGKPTRMIGATSDITERTKYLEDLLQKNNRLKNIAWKQSHLVRAPLARILGLIDILDDENEKVPEHVEQLINHIRNSARELDTVVTGIVMETYEMNGTEKSDK